LIVNDHSMEAVERELFQRRLRSGTMLQLDSQLATGARN
jgi:hypothetical protein